MFNFFKKKKTVDQAPVEPPLEVYVDRDYLYYTYHNAQELVSLNQLDYAYATLLGEDAYLFLVAEKQHYIEVNQKGFAEAYRLLSDRFGFDDALFDQVVAKRELDKARIWIREEPKNYELQAVTNEDYKEGFEVLTIPPQFISWDTSYENLLKMGLTKAGDTVLSASYHTFLYPVRIGGLILNSFGFDADNEQKNVAVLSYGLSLNNGRNTDGSYEELKAYFMELIPTDLEEAGYERADQKYLCFEADGLSFCICYDYAVESNYDNGHTFFSIDNQRNYEATVLKKRDDLRVEDLAFLTFDTPFNFTPNYKNDPKVTGRPVLFDELAGGKTLCYWDKKTDRIGFSDARFAIEFNRKDVYAVIIYNVLPAKGGGYAQLSVEYAGQYPTCVFYGELYSFDAYVDKMKNVLGVPVTLAPESYNC